MSKKRNVIHSDKIILCLQSQREGYPIEERIAQGMESAATQRGYTPVACLVPIDPKNEVRRLVGQFGDKVAGIAIQPYRPNRDLAELLLTPPVKTIPHIIIGHYFDNLHVNSCVIDNYAGMYAITEHLIRCGHRRFAYFGEVSLSSTELERFEGFTHAIMHHGALARKDHIVRSYFEKDLYASLQAMYVKPDSPDAIVCLFDGLAATVMRILRNLKIPVPEKAAVVSFGDDEGIAEKCDPPLSTAYHPAKEMGAAAVHQLINLIEGKIPLASAIYVIPVEVHLRKSCGTPDELLPDGKRFWPVPFSNYIGHCLTLKEAIR